MTKVDQRNPLAPQLAWFIRLRWIAGAVIICAGGLDAFLFHLHPDSAKVMVLGPVTLLYNWLLLWALNAARRAEKPRLLRLAVLQMVLDLNCLTLLINWSGGLHSPILGFYVFHMVFASLLLPAGLAYGSAVAAILLLTGSLAITSQFPRLHPDTLILIGLAVTLILTVTLTNHITLDLRLQRRRLIKQNRSIRRISRNLRKHQLALVRQEKMVALGQMVAGVAHEIANPLASMDSLLQLAQRKPEKINVETIGKLRDQVARIHAIINQMRGMVHPTGAEEQLLPLNDLVSGSVDLVRLDPRARKLGIECALSPDVGRAKIRPQALQQVIVNLLLNALDAIAEAPTPKLTIRTRPADSGYAIDIIDNGHGIKPEHLNRLFEPFFTTKPVGKGTGLGLSISYNLIQTQGGWIDVESEVGVGTTMTIRLPAPAATGVGNATI